jgi:hypothetical protein
MENSNLIYNVTVSVDEKIQSDWISWMLNGHLRDMLSTGCFLGFTFSELHTDAEMGPTYTVQYELASPADFERYEKEFAQQMRQKGAEVFGKKALAYRSTMRIIAKGQLRDQ